MTQGICPTRAHVVTRRGRRSVAPDACRLHARMPPRRRIRRSRTGVGTVSERKLSAGDGRRRMGVNWDAWTAMVVCRADVGRTLQSGQNLPVAQRYRRRTMPVRPLPVRSSLIPRARSKRFARRTPWQFSYGRASRRWRRRLGSTISVCSAGRRCYVRPPRNGRRREPCGCTPSAQQFGHEDLRPRCRARRARVEKRRRDSP